MKTKSATVDRISGGKGLVIKNEIRQFLDVIFSESKEAKPFLDKLEILPKKDGKCHISIKYSPSLYVVPYEKVLEAMEKVLFHKKT